MTSVASLQPDPAPVLACTISRDVQNFDLLIDDMEAALGESWGDLSFEDALAFLGQSDAAALEFVVIAVDQKDAHNLTCITQIIASAQQRGIKVVLVADHLNAASLHLLLRLGAEEFLPYPLPEGALQEVISRLRHHPPASQPPMEANVMSLSHQQGPSAAQGYSAAPPPSAVPPQPYRDDYSLASTPNARSRGNGAGRAGVVMPVHGLSGGVGASSFAVNLAWELANLEGTDHPPRVCVLDLDFQYGSVATYLDLPRRETVFDVLTQLLTIEGRDFAQALVSYQDRLQVFTAPADMLPLDMIGPEEVTRLIDIAAAQFDYVVIDMPRTIVGWTEAVITRADIYFTLMELDLRSAQNVLRLVRALKAEHLPHDKLRYVLNRAPKFTDLSGKSRVKRLAESLDISIEIQLPDGGPQVTQANDQGQPLGQSTPKNALRKELQKLAKSLHDKNKGSQIVSLRQ